MTKWYKQYSLCWAPAFFWESGILVHPKQKMPMWPVPKKAKTKTKPSGHCRSLKSIFWKNKQTKTTHFTHVVTLCLRNSALLCNSIRRGFVQELSPLFLWIALHVPSPLLANSLAIINYNYEFDYVLNPANPVQKISYAGVVFRTHDTSCCLWQTHFKFNNTGKWWVKTINMYFI